MKYDLICEDLIQSNLKLIHSHIVSNHLSQRPPNKVLQDQTPSVSPAELLLSRETRRTLAQLRTNKSPLLVSYLFSIGDPRHPSPLCPLCLMHDHTSAHLFECKSLPTSLSSLDLWTNPDKVEPFLATWGRDCWLEHDSGAGLCWQHVGGVGSTTTTTGVQQGDPIGPLLFAIAVDQIASGVDSELNVWYLDDATIGGSPDSVLSEVQRCITGLKRIGLIVNPKKTEIINVGLAAGKFSRVVNSFNELLPEITVTELTKMELLGSPILADATRCCIMKKLSEHKRMNERILLLDGHPDLFLLKNAFFLPRLLFTLRSAPCHHHPELLSEFDVITRSTTEALCNIHFDVNSWSQAKLPVRYGGLGLRTAADLALPAFLSSRAASISLVNDILRQPTNKQEDDDEVRAWLDRNLVLPSNAHKQRNWDDIQCSSAVATLVPVLNQHRLACFKAASRPESGVWLNCVPNNRIGTFIDNDTLRIGVALRVGLTVCIPHRCKCGTTVDTFGTHPFSCRFSTGRIPRHSALNDVVRRGLSAAGMPSMLEPSGLDRGDGKRPDGITVYLYSRGRCLIWDATCVNTFASSNIIRAALAAGSVADAAEVRKFAKYAELGRRFIFQPVAVETSFAMGKSTIQFFKDLGRRLAVRFQDQRESDFLFQRVSLAILRGNAFSILQSYRD